MKFEIKYTEDAIEDLAEFRFNGLFRSAGASARDQVSRRGPETLAAAQTNGV